MTYELSRPEAALPNSYFWTWDHSTNWALDDPGGLNFGCYNVYLKRPETFIEDYRRLTDLAASLGVDGIIIWGFLRDSHGGIESAKRVADYAHSKGVRILPGIGTTWYGGVYYEGDHPYNLPTFLRRHPEARMLDEKGEPYQKQGRYGACPCHPAHVDWLHEGVQWLFREFAIGGVNFENGDFLVCHCPRCQEQMAAWPTDEPTYMRQQTLSYEAALKAVGKELPRHLVSYATYTGFLPAGQSEVETFKVSMNCERPALADRLPDAAVGQWTLTDMVLTQPLPLTAYLDDGAPEAAFDNPTWPAGLVPPTTRSTGFCHQGSQWCIGRYHQVISTIKEACLRAYRSRLEGVGIHGEVTARHVPWALNYLAFSHFIHWPEDSLREFGRKTLGQVLGNEDEGEGFADILAHWDAGALTDLHQKEAERRATELSRRVAVSKDLERWSFWHWLAAMSSAVVEPHTVSFF